MDGDRFDDLSRKLATAVSRRHAVKGAVAGLLGAIGLRKAADAQVTQAACGNVVCYNWRTQTVDVACNPGCVCCIYANGNSRCTPPGLCFGTVATTTTTAAPTTTTTTTAAPTTTTTTTAAPTTTTTTRPRRRRPPPPRPRRHDHHHHDIDHHVHDNNDRPALEPGHVLRGI